MKTKHQAFQWRPWLLGGFYLAALLLWLLCGAVNALGAAALSVWSPARGDFRLEGMKEREEPYADYTAPLVSTDADPQMLYTVPVTINGVSFRLRGHLPTGTPALYYRKPGEQAYHILYPRSYDAAKGEYIFVCGVLQNVELRLDPVTTAGCIFELSDLQFNVRQPLLWYFIPSLDTAALLAVCPLLTFAAVCEIVSLLKKPQEDKEE